jgi:hypothetical protein
MTPSQYDFAAFLDRIKDLSYQEMLSFAELTLTRAENASRGRKSGLRARQQGSRAFIDEIGEFIFFLKNGVKPSSVSSFNWSLYKTIVQNLVQKGEMKQSALNVFRE